MEHKSIMILIQALFLLTNIIYAVEKDAITITCEKE